MENLPCKVPNGNSTSNDHVLASNQKLHGPKQCHQIVPSRDFHRIIFNKYSGLILYFKLARTFNPKCKIQPQCNRNGQCNKCLSGKYNLKTVSFDTYLELD